jgi:hypothetical protein
VIGLLIATIAVVHIPTLRGYFALVQPGRFEAPLVAVTLVQWFFVMRTVLRRDLPPRSKAAPDALASASKPLGGWLG